jgi:DNA processing protein
LSRPILAVVGAREASMAACRLAGELARALGAAGFVVASGLARGIDAAAHQAALPTGTVAVLAGGIDQVYPPQNAGLQAAIAADGLLLSESPWGAPPVARAFPRRNRIVSGLSKGVVVIEAAARSGSLITAHRAAEQGRDVFVVPGSPADPRYAGSNSLIRDGAILTRDINDILGVLGAPRSVSQVPVKPREKPAHPEAAKVLSALGSVPTLVDELVRRCQVSAAAVAEVLLALELEGRLERHRGNRVSLI